VACGIERSALEATVATTNALRKGSYTRWFITLFPLSMGGEGAWLDELVHHERTRLGGLVWAVGQQEICPETGRKHGHLCMSFDGPKTFAQVSALFPGCRVWSIKIGRTESDLQRIIAYCQKDETREQGPFFFGEVPKPRGQKRTQWAEALDLIQDGKTDAEISQLLPTVGQSNGLDRLRARFCVSRKTAEPPTVILLHGPTGTGKTRAAYSYADASGKTIISIPTYTGGGGKVWWNNYRQQEICLLDDMMPIHVQMAGYWLQVLDRYPMSVEFKGGCTELNSGVIVVTSNCAPAALTDGWPEASAEAFLRRFTHVIELIAGDEEGNAAKIAALYQAL